MQIVRALAFALLAACSMQAWSLDRLFPDTAKRGRLSMEDYPAIAIDGKARRMSPGAWIRNERNTIDLPFSLRGKTYTVNYTENAEGDVDRVWILSETEATQPAPANRKPQDNAR